MHRPLRLVLLATSWLVPTLVIAQAALTGQTLFAGAGLTGLHGGLGHAVLTLTVIAVITSWLVATPRSTSVAFVLLLGLVVAQTGLGYSGHRAAIAGASALHIPLGVVIAVTATALAASVTGWARRLGPQDV